MLPTTRRQVLKAGLAANAALSVAALTEHALAAPASQVGTPGPGGAQTRDIYIAMVPLLVHEDASLYPYVGKAFAKGGVLDGKEVYAFMPPTTVCFAGDTLNVHLINPADDPHTFTVMELSKSVQVSGSSTGSITLDALPAGIYTVMCAEAEHEPWMWGQIIALNR